MEVRHDRSRAAARCRVPHPSRDTIRDDRMDRLELAPRPKYRECLAAGTGYDDEHRALLRELQTEQAERHDERCIAAVTVAADHDVRTAGRRARNAPPGHRA